MIFFSMQRKNIIFSTNHETFFLLKATLIAVFSLKHNMLFSSILVSASLWQLCCFHQIFNPKSKSVREFQENFEKTLKFVLFLAECLGVLRKRNLCLLPNATISLVLYMKHNTSDQQKIFIYEAARNVLAIPTIESVVDTG